VVEYTECARTCTVACSLRSIVKEKLDPPRLALFCICHSCHAQWTGSGPDSGVCPHLISKEGCRREALFLRLRIKLVQCHAVHAERPPSGTQRPRPNNAAFSAGHHIWPRATRRTSGLIYHVRADVHNARSVAPVRAAAESERSVRRFENALQPPVDVLHKLLEVLARALCLLQPLARLHVGVFALQLRACSSNLARVLSRIAAGGGRCVTQSLHRAQDTARRAA